MHELIRAFFDPSYFMPHGHCYFWLQSLVQLHVVSDSLITLSYYSIPMTLVYFVKNKRGLPYPWIFLMFGAFIVACGTTHLMEVITLYIPVYWVSGSIKAVTAALSLVTAIVLVPLVPKALALRSPAVLEAANRQLEQEIEERKRAEQSLVEKARELNRSNTELERFAYAASHDLQEPLRMVVSYTQLLRKRYSGKLDADAEVFITFAVDGVKRMQEMIDALLIYSRAGTQGQDVATVDCNTTFHHALENLGAAIRETGANITCEDLPTLQANGPQLLQLFQNLIGNALKFHGPTPPADPYDGPSEGAGVAFFRSRQRHWY